MKTTLALLFISLCFCFAVSAQVKIGDNPENIAATSLLELESTTRALVITRINTAQMDAMIPSPGAVIYNTDTQCLHYFSGSGWINLCEALEEGKTFSADATVNPIPTIVITETGNNLNFEVGQITGNNIVNGSINGALDIQEGSVTRNNLAFNSVGRDQLEDGAVSEADIDLGEVTLGTFTNDAGYITGATIVSAAPGNVITNDEGAYYNDAALQTAIAANTATGIDNATGLAAHIAADGDLDDSNEIQTLAEVLIEGNAANARITNLLNPTQPQDAATRFYVDNAITGSAQTVVSVNPNNSITPGTDSGAFFNAIPLQTAITTNATGLANHVAADGDLSATNEIQNLAEVLADGNAANASITNLTDPTNPQDAATKSYVDGMVSSGSGQTNTGSNEGLEGVGTFIQKTGVNLEFKNINAGSNRIIILDDVANNEIDIDIDEENLTFPLTLTPTNYTPTTPNLVGHLTGIDAALLTAGGNPTAADVSLVPIGNTISTDVQAAIEELQIEIDGITATGTNPNDELITNFELVDANTLTITEATNDFSVDLDAVFATDAELAALSVNDADADPTNEIQDLVLTGNVLTITNNIAATPIDFSTFMDNTDEQTAAEVAYANTTSELTATNVQAAIDEIVAIGGVDEQQLDDNNTLFDLGTGILTIVLENSANATADFTGLATDTELAALAAIVAADGDTDDENELQDADQVPYNPVTSGLTAVDVQAAIDELAAIGGSDDQNISGSGLAGTILTIGIEGGTSETVELNSLLGTDDQTAGEVAYTNTTSGLTAVDVQAAIDELAATGGSDNQNISGSGLLGTILTIGIENGTGETVELASLLGTDDQTAGEVAYTNTTSGLTAVDVQAAIDELAATGGSDDQNISGSGLAGTVLTIGIEGGTAETVELSSLLGTDDQNAAEVTYDPVTSGLTATDVQDAIDELAATAGSGVNLSNTDLVQVGLTRTYELTNATQSLVFTGLGNIGIGNGANPPANKLHVAGAIRSQGFLNSTGTESQPSYRFNDDTDTGMYSDAADQLGFSVGAGTALLLRETAANGLEVISNGSLELTEQLIDENGNTGNVGDVLTATATGTEWRAPVVVAMGKANGANSVSVNGVTVGGGGGINTVNFSTPQPDANYIIQLTVEGDNRIYVTDQQPGSFTVEIRENGTNNLVTTHWFFTVLDF